MSLIDIIVVIAIVIWLCGGFYGRGNGYYGVGSRPYYGGGGLVFVVVILLVLFLSRGRLL